MSYAFKMFQSPVGNLTLVASRDGLVAVLWENDKPERVKIEKMIKENQHKLLLQAEAELQEYFLGDRKTFSVNIDPRGTDFQKNVWNALQKIPYGETRSYGELAREINRPSASRAVGAANGKNPLSIIVPCHRVIGANGKLVGFAGGLDVKQKLLAIEKSNDVFFKEERVF